MSSLSKRTLVFVTGNENKLKEVIMNYNCVSFILLVQSVKTMDYLRMDRKRGHMTCGNWLAIECKESFYKFASFDSMRKTLALLKPFGLYPHKYTKISHSLIWGKIF